MIAGCGAGGGRAWAALGRRVGTHCATPGQPPNTGTVSTALGVRSGGGCLGQTWQSRVCEMNKLKNEMINCLEIYIYPSLL